MSNPKVLAVLPKVIAGQLTVEEAARIAEVSPHTIRRYLRQETQTTETNVDALAILQDIVNTLKERLDRMKLVPTSDLQHEKVFLMEVKEIRNTLMDLERLAGRLKAAPLIQLQQINVHYEKLLAFITTELCPECRKRVKEWLASQA